MSRSFASQTLGLFVSLMGKLHAGLAVALEVVCIITAVILVLPLIPFIFLLDLLIGLFSFLSELRRPIQDLTPEQEAKLQIYRQWNLEMISNTHTDRKLAEQAIDDLYRQVNLDLPQRKIWVNDPWQGSLLAYLIYLRVEELEIETDLQEWIEAQFQGRHEVRAETSVIHRVRGIAFPQFHKPVYTQFRRGVEEMIRDQIIQESGSRIQELVIRKIHEQVIDCCEYFDLYESGDYNCCWDNLTALLTYYTDVLDLDLKFTQGIPGIENCNWFWPYEDTVILTPNPSEIHLDTEGRLHADGKPALRYPDPSPFSIWAWHGVLLPEEYQMALEFWRSEWILTAPNAELRRVLIQGISYSRICSELNAKLLDRWREYELLEIQGKIDVEPIKILKMTCSSTDFIHALRVPPAMNSARQAIRWCNWDVDPTEFGRET